jgi:hypothetical protein
MLADDGGDEDGGGCASSVALPTTVGLELIGGRGANAGRGDTIDVSVGASRVGDDGGESANDTVFVHEGDDADDDRVVAGVAVLVLVV